MTKPLCKLCLENPADKANSHIISKFLLKGLFEGTNPRHAVSFNKDLKGRKVQDALKQNDIFCSSCERRIEIIETHFAKVIAAIKNYKKYPAKFPLSKLGTQQFIECVELNPILYKLFLYSIIWRTSISNLYECQPFKLESKPEEILRQFLNNNLYTTKKQLIENLDSIIDVPKYHSCIIKPKDRVRGVLSIASMSKHAHALFLVDFVIFFYTDESSIGEVLIHFSNKENRNVIIALGEIEAWTKLNELFVTKMVNSKKGG